MADQFFESIVRFLRQTQTDDLSSKDYPREYHDLKVKFGFGAGNQTKVPWIAFRGFGQEVQNGIYPVFLFYKSKQVMILAYGISATNTPENKWEFDGTEPQTIGDYFLSNGLGKPDKFDQSFVSKPYIIDSDKTNFGLDEAEVMTDLDAIITKYKNQFKDQPLPPPTLPENQRFDVSHFVTAATAANYRVTSDLATRYVASLLTKPFVILTGLSGSGKTKLAQVFAQWICKTEDQYRLVPVGADWTNREPLLGYPNALDPGKYVSPDSQVLELIIEAGKPENQNKPYFLILDEMNMSHVERYFADFLSAMESGQDIFLHPGSVPIDGIPPSVKLPSNLFIVGTVNIDETTYMFSPKVLDRANVIEFRVDDTEMDAYLENHTSSKISMKQGLGAQYSGGFMVLRNGGGASQSFAREELMKFFKELKPIGAEFGYRTAAEMNRFCALMKELGPKKDDNSILDGAILQKLLPKVHGSRKKLDPVLKTLLGLCLDDPDPKTRAEVVEKLIAETKSPDDPDVPVSYPLSLQKLLRMYRNMTDNGFTSFTEA